MKLGKLVSKVKGTACLGLAGIVGLTALAGVSMVNQGCAVHFVDYRKRGMTEEERDKVLRDMTIIRNIERWKMEHGEPYNKDILSGKLWITMEEYAEKYQ